MASDLSCGLARKGILALVIDLSRCYYFKRGGISAKECARALETLCDALLAVISRFIRADVRSARLRRDLQTLNQRTIDYTPIQNDPYRGSHRMREMHSTQEVLARDIYRTQEFLDCMSEQMQAIVLALEAAGMM